MPDACPGTPGHCSCPEHHQGLLAFSRDPAALEAALAKLKPTTATLRIVTPQRLPDCTGSMTCSCQRCLKVRAERIAKGPLQGDRQQPWHLRPPRHLRAA
jgi:hypothetical protein